MLCRVEVRSAPVSVIQCTDRLPESGQLRVLAVREGWQPALPPYRSSATGSDHPTAATETTGLQVGYPSVVTAVAATAKSAMHLSNALAGRRSKV